MTTVAASPEKVGTRKQVKVSGKPQSGKTMPVPRPTEELTDALINPDEDLTPLRAAHGERVLEASEVPEASTDIQEETNGDANEDGPLVEQSQALSPVRPEPEPNEEEPEPEAAPKTNGKKPAAKKPAEQPKRAGKKPAALKKLQKAANKPRQSRSSRAGLHAISVSAVQSFIRENTPEERISSYAPVAMASAAEYGLNHLIEHTFCDLLDKGIKVAYQETGARAIRRHSLWNTTDKNFVVLFENHSESHTEILDQISHSEPGERLFSKTSSLNIVEHLTSKSEELYGKTFTEKLRQFSHEQINNHEDIEDNVEEEVEGEVEGEEMDEDENEGDTVRDEEEHSDEESVTKKRSPGRPKGRKTTGKRTVKRNKSKKAKDKEIEEEEEEAAPLKVNKKKKAEPESEEEEEPPKPKTKASKTGSKKTASKTPTRTNKRKQSEEPEEEEERPKKKAKTTKSAK